MSDYMVNIKGGGVIRLSSQGSDEGSFTIIMTFPNGQMQLTWGEFSQLQKAVCQDNRRISIGRLSIESVSFWARRPVLRRIRFDEVEYQVDEMAITMALNAIASGIWYKDW